MSVRSVFPPAAVFQSATPADRTSYRSSLGFVCVRAARACVLVRKAYARAGKERRAAKKKKKKKEVPAKEGQGKKVRDKKESCVAFLLHVIKRNQDSDLYRSLDPQQGDTRETHSPQA